MNLGCSTGWLTRFFSRHDLVLRQGTRRPILSDDQVIERGLNFIQQARSLISTYDIPLSCIYNLDETAIFFDHSKQKTVELRGALDVPIKSFGLEKTRITAVMAASADGIKRKPCILLRSRGDETSIRQENGMVLLTTKNSWMNSNAFIAYIKFEFAFLLRPLLLIFDSARSHISQMVKSFLHANNILTLVIPGGMTGFLQPADFSWFKSVKSALACEIDAWKLHGPFEYTSGNRVKAPPIEVYGEWIKAAWNQVDKKIVEKSFVRWVVGKNDELSLARHDKYGDEFCRRLQQIYSDEETKESSEDGYDIDIVAEYFDDLLVIDEYVE
ncbi:hypothetical protein AeMF1_004702 [Aphanomyces euteiches]|nr:hypothetical protein AeMF1_004702 [Aphanomyces euteiches]